MNDSRPPQIRPHHLQRLACIYIRQSTARQVLENTGSTDVQRGQKEYAIRWGWPASAIEIVADDLGLSGMSTEHRKGWQALLKKVANEQVGLILAADTSRLTRSSADFETLLGVCEATNTLLAVEGVIVDPNDSANRLLARLRGNVAQYENEQRTETFMKAKRAKVAKHGLAITLRPTGYVTSQKGRWVKDADAGVRQAIEEVFRQYALLKSMGKVLRFLDAQGLQLPVRLGTGELRWTRPTHSRIHMILCNPAYAGYYIYGRRRKVKGSRTDRRRRVDWADCLVVPDHHEPYIPPAAWHAINDCLRKSRVPFGPPSRNGAALCHGLMRCGRCGRPMHTHYYRHVRTAGYHYVCENGRQQYGEANCWSVNGVRLDEVVGTELLRSLTPPDVEAVLEAADEVNGGHEAARRQREGELERVRYEAQLAERRYKLVDPANRLVAATLEADWDEAKQRVQAVERQQAETPLTRPLEITADTLDAIRQLGANLPALWTAPSTTHLDRKRLVRLLVREIRVVANSEVDFEVEIAWVGGAATRHRVFRPKAGVLLARRLAAEGRTATEIVAELNRLGITAQRSRRPYEPEDIRHLITGAGKTAGLPWRAYRDTLRGPLAELLTAGWSDAAIATEFNRRGVRTSVFGRLWSRQGIGYLRRTLGLWHPPLRHRPGEGAAAPRVRVRELLRMAAEALRAPLAELVQAGWSDRAIATDFNGRDLPKWGHRASWDKAKICNLRHKLGIQSVAGPCIRLPKRALTSEAGQ